MAFNLTAQLQVRAPNLRPIITNINKQLANVAVVNPVASNASANANAAAAATAKLGKQTKAAARSAKDLGSNFQESVRRAAGLSVALGTIIQLQRGLIDGTKAALDFDRELARLQQVTGKTKGQLKGLVNEVRSLSKEFGSSSQELLEASRTLAQAGFAADTTKRLLDTLAKTDVAATFDNIGDTVEGVIALLNQFGKEVVGSANKAAFAADVLDKINVVSKTFAVESADLITVIRRAGSVFKEAGGSVEELLAAFTSVRSATRESAESIAVGFRTIFTRIQRVETIQQLKSLGIELQDVQGKFIGPLQAVEELSKALKALDPKDARFSAIVEELGGFRQVSKVIPLIKNYAVTQKAIQVQQRAANSLTQDSAVATDTYAQKISKLKEEFLDLIYGFTQTKGFKDLADSALAFASGVGRIIEQMQKLLPMLITLGGLKLGTLAAGAIPGRGPRKFKTGGMVPGTGNTDSVHAMVEPGEYVLRSSAVRALQSDGVDLDSLNRYATGGSVGYAVLGKKNKATSTSYSLGNTIPSESGARKNIDKAAANKKVSEAQANKAWQRAVPKSMKNFSITFAGPKGSPTMSEDFTEAVETSYLNAISAASKSVGEPFGLTGTDITKSNRASVLKGLNDATIGNLFEQTLTNLSGERYDSNPNPRAAYDLPKGLGNAGKLFPELKTFTPVEAKATMQAAGKKNDRIKKWANYLGEKVSLRKIEREIDRGDKKSQGTKAAAASKYTKHQAGSFKMPKIGKSRGGTIDARFSMGGGQQNQDSVNAKVMPGEFIVNAKSAKRIGLANLEQMNQSGKPLHFAKGGPVPGRQIKRFSTGGKQGSGLGGTGLLLSAGLIIGPALEWIESFGEGAKRVTASLAPLAAAGFVVVPMLYQHLSALALNKAGVESLTVAQTLAVASTTKIGKGMGIATGIIAGFTITSLMATKAMGDAAEATAKAAEELKKIDEKLIKGESVSRDDYRQATNQLIAQQRSQLKTQAKYDDPDLLGTGIGVGGSEVAAGVGAIGGGLAGAKIGAAIGLAVAPFFGPAAPLVAGVGALAGAVVGATLAFVGLDSWIENEAAANFNAALVEAEAQALKFGDAMDLSELNLDPDIEGIIRLNAAARSLGEAFYDSQKALVQLNKAREDRARAQKESGKKQTSSDIANEASADFAALDVRGDRARKDLKRAQEELRLATELAFKEAGLWDEQKNAPVDNATITDLPEATRDTIEALRERENAIVDNLQNMHNEMSQASIKQTDAIYDTARDIANSGGDLFDVFNTVGFRMKEYEQQLRELGYTPEEVAESMQRLRDGVEEQYETIRKLKEAQEQRLAIEEAFQTALKATADSLLVLKNTVLGFKSFSNTIKNLGNTLTGTSSIATNDLAGVLANSFGSASFSNDMANALTNVMTNTFGAAGSVLANDFANINNAVARLPEALKQLKVAASDLSSGDVDPRTLVKDILGDAGLADSDIGGYLADYIEQGILASFTGAGADFSGAEVEKFIKELGEKAKAFVGEVVNLQNQYTTAQGAIVTELYKTGDAIRTATGVLFDNIIKNRDRLDKARGTDRGLGQRARERAQRFGAQYGTTNIRALVGRGRIARAGAAANVADINAASASMDFETIRKLNTENAAFAAEIRKSKQAIKDYSAVLDANASDIAAAIEDEKSKREAYSSKLKEFTFADNAGRKQIAQSFTALNAALNAGTIEAIPDSLRGAVGSLLDQFKDVQIAGGLTGGQISKGFQVQTLDRLIKSQGGKGVTPQQIKQIYESTTTEDKLLRGLQGIMQEQAAVDQMALQFERDNVLLLKNSLEQLQTTFLASLGGIFNTYFGNAAGVGGAPQFNNAGGKIFSSIFQSRGSDTVPAMLTPGEFVMSKNAVNRIGLGTLQAMNNGTQYFNEGGAVQVADGKSSAISMARYIGNNPKLMRQFGYKGKDDLKILKESNNVLDILRAADDPVNGPIGTLYRSLNIMKKFSSAGLFKTLNGRAVEFDTTSSKGLYQNFLKEWGTVGGNYGSIGAIGKILPQALLAFDAVSGAVRDFMGGGKGSYNMRHGDAKYMKKLKAQYRSGGGMINRADTVPAMLSKGEFVMSKSAVSKHGGNFLNALNNGKVSGFYNGGNVGSVARSGTGGYNSGGGLDASGLAREFENLGQKLQGVADALDGLTIKHTVTMDGSMTIGGFDSKTIAKAVKNEVEELVVKEVKQRMGKRGFRAG